MTEVDLRLHLLDAMPDAAWLKDTECHFRAVNRAFAEQCGVARSELVGATEASFFSRRQVRAFRDDDRRVLVSRRRNVFTEISLDGAVWHTVKAPWTSDHGEILGTVGVTRRVLGDACGAARPHPSAARGQARPSARWPAWLEEIRGELERGRTVNLSALAARLRVSPDTLGREFRRCVGMPIREYVQRVRVERTAMALAEASGPLSIVALEHGYADQSHMTRAFRRYLGMTPAAYRDAR